MFPHGERPYARPEEPLPSRHTVNQNILESAHSFQDINSPQPARGGYRFYQIMFIHGSDC